MRCWKSGGAPLLQVQEELSCVFATLEALRCLKLRSCRALLEIPWRTFLEVEELFLACAHLGAHRCLKVSSSRALLEIPR